ncbi:MAG: diphosphomevalonate decarboxylase [Myxococcota bacterium]
MTRRVLMGAATATAQANIALAKYWGKADLQQNIPAVPSISLTLQGLTTKTRVRFFADRQPDLVFLDRREASPKERQRVVDMLDRVRSEVGCDLSAEVRSENRFPTAAGLASSASGFAALASASVQALGLNWSPTRLSRLARRSSASAARSLFGGFVELPTGEDDRIAARPLAPADHWDVRFVVASTALGPKAVGSTEGMERSRKTSPVYAAWLEQAPMWTRRIRNAVRARDLEELGATMERSTLLFHTCAITSVPPIYYWLPATLGVMSVVRELRERSGISAWFTMDAGPHVKVLCQAKDAPRVRRALAACPGVLDTKTTRPGDGVVSKVQTAAPKLPRARRKRVE